MTHTNLSFLGSHLARTFRVVGLVVAICLGIAVLPLYAAAPAPVFTIEMHDSLLDITAENVPLRQVLAAIAQKSGVILRFADQDGELISCRLTSVSLPESLEKILGNWNYALVYKKDRQGRSVPDTLWVINRNPQRMTVDVTGDGQRLTRIGGAVSAGHENLPKFKKEDIRSVFADSEKILTDFEAAPFSVGEHNEGVEITTLADTSPLKLIGLQPGDVIRNINGQAVNSAEELVNVLATPIPAGVSVVRIEKHRDGRIETIYLHLE